MSKPMDDAQTDVPKAHRTDACCADWEPQTKKLNAPLHLAQARNPAITQTEAFDFKAWDFCPWCGASRLASPRATPAREEAQKLEWRGTADKKFESLETWLMGRGLSPVDAKSAVGWVRESVERVAAIERETAPRATGSSPSRAALQKAVEDVQYGLPPHGGSGKCGACSAIVDAVLAVHPLSPSLTSATAPSNDAEFQRGYDAGLRTCAAELAANKRLFDRMSAASATAGDLIGWVIERGKAPNRQCLGTTSRVTGGVFLWHTHFAEALRFSTKEDAEKIAGAIRRAMETVVQRDVLDGFRMTDAPVEVCEHRWIGGLVPDNSAASPPVPESPSPEKQS